MTKPQSKLYDFFIENLELTPSMVKQVLVFVSGLKAQEKINQEQASQSKIKKSK